MLAFNSNVPFATKLECPLRKGRGNGHRGHEQRGIESIGNCAEIGRKADAAMHGGGDPGDQRSAGEAVGAGVSGRMIVTLQPGPASPPD